MDCVVKEKRWLTFVWIEDDLADSMEAGTDYASMKPSRYAIYGVTPPSFQRTNRPDGSPGERLN